VVVTQAGSNAKRSAPRDEEKPKPAPAKDYKLKTDKKKAGKKIKVTRGD